MPRTCLACAKLIAPKVSEQCLNYATAGTELFEGWSGLQNWGSIRSGVPEDVSRPTDVPPHVIRRVAPSDGRREQCNLHGGSQSRHENVVRGDEGFPVYSQQDVKPSADHVAKTSPRGLTCLGFFLIFGALMGSLAGTTLVWRGTTLDRVWVLNPRAYIRLAPFGTVVGIAFFLLSLTLAVAAFGWFKRRLWGWWLTVVIIATQVLGDLVNLFLGRDVEGWIGVAIAGGLLFYLLRQEVRAAFVNGQARNLR